MSPLAIATAPAEPAVWLRISKAARELGIAKRTLYRQVDREEIVSRETDQGVEVLLSSLPQDAQRRYAARRGAIVGLPRGVDKALAIQVAAARWEVLARWEALSSEAKREAAGEQLRREYAAAGAPLEAQCGSLVDVLCPSSMDRTLRRAREMWAAGENGVLATLGRVGVRKSVEHTSALPEAAVHKIRSLWLDDGLRTKRGVWRAFLESAKKLGWPKISYSTCARIVDTCPPTVLLLARRGLSEFRAKACPYITRDDSELAAGEVFSGDHHELDFFARDERGRLRRPWVTGVLDVASRTMVGRAIVWTPSSRSIKAATAYAIRPKRRPEYELMCGVPKVMYVDNGKDYRSHDLEGVERVVLDRCLDQVTIVELNGFLPSLGIEQWHAIVENAKAKVIERAFGTIACGYSQTVPGYCGRNAQEKPTEQLKALIAQHSAWIAGRARSTPFLTLRQVEETFDAWLYGYHTREHDGLSKQGQKLSPADVYRLRGRTPELVDDQTLELLLMTPTRCKVQKNGVRVEGVDYWSPELGDLYRPTGKKVEVLCRRDPVDAGRVYVHTLRSNFLCEAINTPVLRTGASAEELAAAMAPIREYEKRQKKARKTLTELAPPDALSALEAIKAAAPPELPEPIVPQNAVRRLVPGFDGVELRTKAPAAEPPSELLHLMSDEVQERPPALEAPRLVMFDCEREEPEQDQLFSVGGSVK